MLPIHTRGSTYYENYNLARNNLGVYSNFNITAQYNFNINRQTLSNGLRNLLLQNPIFTVNYFKGDKSEAAKNLFDYTVKPSQTISFDDIVEYVPLDHPFNAENLQEINLRRFELSINKPIWKLLVHEFKDQQYLTFLCDHTIFDGNGACFFHDDLLKELSKLKDNTQLEELDTIFDYEDDLHLLHALPETTLKLTSLYNLKYFFFNWVILSEILPKFITNFVWKNVYDVDFDTYKVFTHKRVDIKSKICYRIINLSQDETKSIMTSLRSEKLTFTPYLLGIISEQLRVKVFPYISEEEKIISASIVVDGRRYYPELHQQLKYNFAVSDARVFVPPLLKLKEVIERSSKIIKDAVTSRNGFQMVNMINYINIWDFIQKRFGKYDRATFEISNLGYKKFQTSDGSEITNLIFSQDVGLSGHFVFSVVGTPAGGINIVLCNLEETEELKNASTYNKVMDEFVQALKASLIESIDTL
ncbi:putative alcohol acetyltransferase [Scheffersomyces coipomensis]|uniref:putative alcohol acetyltransferase n=1 Tax=Scheffersomyces coipomensis TaxID=1788519 RepID=UPI00315C6283